MSRKPPVNATRAKRASDQGLMGQIRATVARIGERLGRHRNGDRAIDAALSPVFFIADVLYIVPNAVYLAILIAVFIITLPIQVAFYLWLWFSN